MALSNLVIGSTAIVSILGLVVLALPARKRVERSAVVAASPEAVFEVLSSTAGFQTFNPYRDDEPELKIVPFGPASGIGAGFAFEGKSTKGTQTITQCEPNKSVTMQIDLGSMGKPTQTFTVTPDSGGTRVTWATESAFGMNPIGRVFGLMMDGYLGPIYERGLANLAKTSVAAAR
jgi:carbon monoxide dehydrogenase subunit G